MAQSEKIDIPITCENPQCENAGRLVNVISEIAVEEIDLFYESYDGSDDADYCLTCEELGVAGDPEKRSLF